MLRIHFDLANKRQPGPRYHLQVGGRQHCGELSLVSGRRFLCPACFICRVDLSTCLGAGCSHVLSSRVWENQARGIRGEGSRKVSQEHLLHGYLEKAHTAVSNNKQCSGGSLERAARMNATSPARTEIALPPETRAWRTLPIFWPTHWFGQLGSTGADSWLDPSAGAGRLVEAALKSIGVSAKSILAIDLQTRLPTLKRVRCGELAGHLTSCPGRRVTDRLFDRVIANPPFVRLRELDERLFCPAVETRLNGVGISGDCQLLGSVLGCRFAIAETGRIACLHLTCGVGIRELRQPVAKTMCRLVPGTRRASRFCADVR